MKKFNLFVFLSIILLFSSCGTVKEGFSSQKKNNSDEFLVEKKSPLSMPPDYDSLPIPKSDKKNISNIYLKKNDKIEIVHFIGGG